MKLVSRIAGSMPDPPLYRSIAASFRLRSEQRLLFVDDLVRRGCTAVNIGAWWGPWTYWLTRRAASVWAFEPNPRKAGANPVTVALHTLDSYELTDVGFIKIDVEGHTSARHLPARRTRSLGAGR